MHEIAPYRSAIEKQLNKKNETTSKGRIFLVEDEMLVLEDLKQRLIERNYEIAGTASSGNEAIENIKASDPDLVIMDIRIKGELDGIEVALIIRSYFDSRPVPVIFLTGLSEKETPYVKTLSNCLFINKPYEDRVLFDVIKLALTRIRQRRGFAQDK